jgi:hypothetical protein
MIKCQAAAKDDAPNLLRKKPERGSGNSGEHLEFTIGKPICHGSLAKALNIVMETATYCQICPFESLSLKLRAH